MLSTLIQTALRHRYLVLALAVVLCGLGVWSFRQQKIDAYPDISGQMVQIITTFPGRAPEEVERQVTIPIERAMGNVPRVEVVRSRTIFGLSVVQLSFEEGVDGYWARQRIMEKLNSIDLPDTAKPDLGPLATAYGEIYRYELRSDGVTDLMELRTLNDWVVIPRLLRAAGVADVSNFGGQAKQFAIILQPSQLQRYGLTLGDVLDALKANNADAGGSVLSRGSISFVVRGRGAVQDLKAIGAIFVKSVGGTPIYLRDVADVTLDYKVQAGIYSKDASGEGVEGIVLMRRGENPSEVLDNVKAVIDKLNHGVLPEGITVVPFYDRTFLVNSTLQTVGHSVGLGITLVVLILLLFLGRPSMAFLVALTIPFSLLFALVLLYVVGIPIGLLSIGAIDFGIIVDGAVIMADSIAERLGAARREGSRLTLTQTILAAAQEVERPMFFSVLMIVGAYLPLLTLTRIEGLLFRPMAMTLVFALIGALLFALFLVPVLASIFFQRGYVEWENPLLRWSRPIYAAILRRLLRFRRVVAITLITLLGGTVAILGPRMGIEFLPYMDEGVIWVRANFPEGTSLEKTSELSAVIRSIIREYPDFKVVSTQAGRNDSGTDPFPPSRLEMMIIPKPREQWTQFKTKREMLRVLGARLRKEFPTTRFNFTQPIIDSVTEDTNGTSADLAVEYTGPNSDELLRLAREAVDLLKQIRGATDVNIEQEGPQPQLLIQPDRARCARYNVRVEDVTRLINIAMGGEPVGTLFEGDRKFDIVVKFDRASMNSKQAVERLPVYNQDGVAIPLEQVASIEPLDGQTLIAREGGRRRITVRCDIVGRDQGGFVAEAQELFESKQAVPEAAGYRRQWLGMFENLDRARHHFMILIPVAIAMIFGLLVFTFKSYKAALLLIVLVPFSFVGGAVALYIRGMNFNVSTGVGFAALFGVSLMDGILMVKAITTLRQRGNTIDDAVVQGAQSRIRQILMTALGAMLGLMPASLSTGLGSDVQRPLATVIVWGLFSAMLLTLFIVPVSYRLFAPPLPRAPSAAPSDVAEFIEPLPDVSPADVVAVVEYLHQHPGESDVFRIASDLRRDFSQTVGIVQAAETLGLVATPTQKAMLTDLGRRFAEAGAEQRKVLWRQQLLTLGLFRELFDIVQRQPEHVIDREFVLETIVMRMPYENYERVFNTMMRWSRFGELFAYDEVTQQLRLV